MSHGDLPVAVVVSIVCRYLRRLARICRICWWICRIGQLLCTSLDRILAVVSRCCRFGRLVSLTHAIGVAIAPSLRASASLRSLTTPDAALLLGSFKSAFGTDSSLHQTRTWVEPSAEQRNLGVWS